MTVMLDEKLGLLPQRCKLDILILKTVTRQSRNRLIMSTSVLLAIKLSIFINICYLIVFYAYILFLLLAILLYLSYIGYRNYKPAYLYHLLLALCYKLDASPIITTAITVLCEARINYRLQSKS